MAKCGLQTAMRKRRKCRAYCCAVMHRMLPRQVALQMAPLSTMMGSSGVADAVIWKDTLDHELYVVLKEGDGAGTSKMFRE